MPEVQKYNLKEKLLEADETKRGDPALVGKSAMTFYRYNNSTRTQMFDSHLDQAMTLVHGDFSNVSTGVENVVGKYSSGYKKTDGEIEIYKKIIKFEKLVDKPYFYQLFYWDTKRNRYDVVQRKEIKDLSQTYGFKYNNDVIDSLHEGEVVPKDTVLFKSTSYDDYMNYRYGKNLNVLYSLEPYTTEDAATISEYAMDSMTYIHSKKVKWLWNQNDIPLNLYGEGNEYRPLPNIGEEVEGYVVSSRPQVNEQILYDLMHSNLKQILDTDRTVEYNGHGIVLDYDLYCNATDIPDNSFTRQIHVLLEAQEEYWKQIQETCLEIINSGKEYSNRIDSLYDRSKKFLEENPKRKWNNGTSVFGYIEFRCLIMEYIPLSKGGKFTARYGNKSVCSRVLPNYMMPFTADGKRVDVILNLLSITNRTTGFVLHEIYINWIMDNTIREMKKTTDWKKREKLFFDILQDLSEKQWKRNRNTFDSLSEEEKCEYLDEIMAGRYTIEQDMLEDDEGGDVFKKLGKIRKKYTYLKPDNLYIYKWGQIYQVHQVGFVGKMYFFPLKQTDRQGFSARNTGAINMKGLPERSYKNKRDEAVFSDTAIRFGEYEAMNFMIGLSPEELAVTNVMYRTSLDATKDLTNSQFIEKGFAPYKKYYKSRAAEIFNVIFKSLGLGLQFGDTDNEIFGVDSTQINTHLYNGKHYICTDWEFYLMTMREKVKEKILEECVVISTEELERRIEEEMKQIQTLIGPPPSDTSIV